MKRKHKSFSLINCPALQTWESVMEAEREREKKVDWKKVKVAELGQGF